MENLRGLPAAAWILFGGTFINRFGTFVMPFLVIYLTKRGYGTFAAGVAVSAYGFGHLCASLVGGYLADHFGRRNTIALSMFSSCAAMVALSQASSYPLILILTFITGGVGELYRPAAGALIGDLVSPEQRITAFGVYRLAINAGFALGPATAGFVANKSFTLLFLGDAATSAIYGVIALLFLPHGLRHQAHGEPVGEGFRVALRDTAFVTFLISTVCITWIEFQVHSTLPLYIRSLGYSTVTYGLLMSINGVMIVVFELAITAWTQRFEPQRTIALGYALSAIGFALTGLASSVPALAATVVVWTLGEMIYAPVTGAYVTTLAPEKYRGRYQGLWVLMWSIGMILGPAIGTALFSRNPAVLWIACAVVGCAGSGMAVLRTRSASRPERAAL